MRGSCSVMSCGVLSVAIVVISFSVTLSLRKCMGSTGPLVACGCSTSGATSASARLTRASGASGPTKLDQPHGASVRRQQVPVPIHRDRRERLLLA
jgi:hypothetical protein